jgi:hypothetical protein
LSLVDESVEHRLAGVVASEGGSAERLPAEVPLVGFAIFGSAERHSPLVQLPELVRHPLGDRLHLFRVVHEVTLVERVCRVDRPVVLGVVGAECPVDTTTSPCCVSVAVTALADHQKVLGRDSLINEFDRCTCTGRTCTHD